jgi:hypothetical protein
MGSNALLFSGDIFPRFSVGLSEFNLFCGPLRENVHVGSSYERATWMLNEI